MIHQKADQRVRQLLGVWLSQQLFLRESKSFLKNETLHPIDTVIKCMLSTALNIVLWDCTKINCTKILKADVVCRICKMPALFRKCPAVKVWEFQDHYVLVKHTGVNTCHPVPPFSQRDEQVKENVEKRLDLPPKRIQREAILDQLYSGKTIEEVKSKARAMIDTKKISPVKRIQSQSIRPFGHSLDALKRLKQETKKTDKYYIFDIGDATLSGNKTNKTRFQNE